jgi:hypothetical protein
MKLANATLPILLLLAVPQGLLMGAAPDMAEEMSRCSMLTQKASQDWKLGVSHGEDRQWGDGVGGGPFFANARAAFAEAYREVQLSGLTKSNPQFTAIILGEDAWFRGNVDMRVDQSIKELGDAIELSPRDAVLHYKLACLLHLKSWVDSQQKDFGPKQAAALKAAEAAEVRQAMHLDPQMPEPYLLQRELDFGSAPLVQLNEDYKKFLQYAGRASPELYEYNKKQEDNLVTSTQTYLEQYQKYIDSHPSTEPSGGRGGALP